MRHRLLRSFLILALLAALPIVAPALQAGRQFHVSPEGRAGNAGTREQPWDLGSALSGGHSLAPGDTVWIHGGTYKGKVEVRLQGSAERPIQVRAAPGERATILDGGVAVMPPTRYLWMWDLEVAGSAPVEKRETKQTGSHPTDLPGTDGLNIYAGAGCKFIHLIVHDNVGNGIGWWLESTDSEVYGCVIYDNGWRAPDRGHGHCIYTQNRDGVKTVSNCILSVPNDGSYSMHAYGSSRAFVDNYLIQDNVAFGKGPFLVGGGSPSHGIHVRGNFLYGANMRIGYGAENEDCEVTGNVLAKGTISIEKYRTVVRDRNRENVTAAFVKAIPSKYEPGRIHVAAYNPEKRATVPLDLSGLASVGQRFRLLRALDLYGKPVLEGEYRGQPIALPMTGEFEAFVLRLEPRQ